MLTQRDLSTTYRPQNFSEVVGQEIICKTLSNAAYSDQIASGYIFSGIRGVGKTTVARIFAKAINCEKAPTKEPCNECKICKQITKGVCVDVLEIDGASHTGVDNIRKLNEDISHRPVECRYKVIIIDEAHMLSKSAFNALLKTLEEPPGYVTFIFATTEPHRFPATIISRCQHFVFKRIPKIKIVEHLEKILKKEKIIYQKEALELIAQKGEGSLRDSLSMLSQVLSISSSVSVDIVKEALGIADRQRIYKIISLIKDKDIKGILKETEDLMNRGIDISFFLQEFTNVWRDLFIAKTSSSDVKEILDISEEEALILEDLCFGFSIQQIHSAWQMSLAQQKNIFSFKDPGLALQLLFFNIAYLPDLISIEKQTDLLNQDTEKREEVKKENKPKDWAGFLNFLKSSQKDKEFPNLKIANPQIDENKITLRCPGLLADRLEEKLDKLKELIEKYFDKKMEISLVKEQQNMVGEKERIKKQFLQHPKIKKIIEEFDADVEDIIFTTK